MRTLTLKKGFRVDENEVKALFIHNERRQEFVVTWNNIHPSTGEVDNYDIQIDCLSNSSQLNEIIEDAIREGEWDGIYYDLCDQFDSQDCEDL